jgi:hypothetical protein
MVIAYQLVLVLLSIGVAVIGSLISLALTSGLHTEGESREQAFSLANGGLIMGTTIWAMHFIAMMAAQVPVFILQTGHRGNFGRRSRRGICHRLHALHRDGRHRVRSLRHACQPDDAPPLPKPAGIHDRWSHRGMRQ